MTRRAGSRRRLNTSAGMIEKKDSTGKRGIAYHARIQNSLDKHPACLLLYRSFKRPATMPR